MYGCHSEPSCNFLQANYGMNSLGLYMFGDALSTHSIGSSTYAKVSYMQQVVVLYETHNSRHRFILKSNTISLENIMYWHYYSSHLPHLKTNEDKQSYEHKR